ncbi:DUF4307 domain-containing protein [Actinomadura sp. GC306]|uniref:DUF4307 domain-containing protein n=1 Tax=Actinomadura sp. GC306 TaxID=2530367 RepID=UPI0010536384|nr:DUF4307 domain-containing protein [Actinomadura sp. GC306]TDC64023.1 DUF4307 domain-containing protein [Actinomadura sp. GC306]
MTTSVSKPTVPAEPRKKGRLGLVVIGVVVALAAGGFGVISMYAGQTPGIVSQTVTYDITDTSVVINYSVAKGEDDVVHCTVDAFDKEFAILAEKEVVVPAGTSSVKGTETLQTPQRATGARIHGCRPA